MPMLLEDLAEETAASHRRLADRMEAEVHELAALEPTVLRQRVIESSRLANAYALTSLPPSEEAWNLALAALRKQPTPQQAERLLRTFLSVFESGQHLVQSARQLWNLAVRMGADAEHADELERAETRFKVLAAEAQKGLDHRADSWQPSDPARLALGLNLARQGRTISAAEARTRFRRTPS